MRAPGCADEHAKENPHIGGLTIRGRLFYAALMGKPFYAAFFLVNPMPAMPTVSKAMIEGSGTDDRIEIAFN